VVLVTAALLGTAACSGDPAPAPAPSAPAVSPAPASPTAPSASGSAPSDPSAGPSAPAGDCLRGTYRLDRFVGVGESQTYGTGSGGDVSVTFTADGYTLRGAGDDPIELTLAGGTGQLRVDGTVEGSYAGTGPQYDFTVNRSDGSATVDVGDQRQSLSMEQVASVLAPAGQATLACNPPRMVLLLANVRLELSQS